MSEVDEVPTWFAVWANEYFLTLGGMRGTPDAVLAWWGRFKRSAYTETEVAEAYTALTLDTDRSPFREQHLVFIQRYIHDRRMRGKAKVAPQSSYDHYDLEDRQKARDMLSAYRSWKQVEPQNPGV